MNPCERHEDFQHSSHAGQEPIKRSELFLEQEQPPVALCRRLDEILAEAFRQAHDQPRGAAGPAHDGTRILVQVEPQIHYPDIPASKMSKDELI